MAPRRRLTEVRRGLLNESRICIQGGAAEDRLLLHTPGCRVFYNSDVGAIL
jgi:hypothetical protein